MEKLGKNHLLSQLGNSITSVQDIADAKSFLRTCMFAGTENEKYVQTRIRMYEKQKLKWSSSLLPDESSADEHIKRSDLQAFIWYQCLKQNIVYPSLANRGWEETEDGIRPTWFTCPQFPPSLSRTISKTRSKSGIRTSNANLHGEVDYDDDDKDGESSSGQPPNKKKRRSSGHTKVGDEYLADSGGFKVRWALGRLECGAPNYAKLA